MRKPLLKALIIFSLILLVFTACDHNVYMGEPERITPSLWKVNNTYFDSLQEAMDYIYGNTKGNSKSKSITDIPLSRTAILQRDVLHSNGETGGGLIVPEDFTGQLVIDFNGFTYEFDNSLDHFFDVRGGDEVYIINGTTVIYNEASHVPFAVAVNTDTLTIDDHLIDDRRWDPTNNVSDAKLFDVGPEGSLVVTNISSSETGATLSGVIAIATDGIENGGKIQITNSTLVISNIFTTYEDSEGNIQPTIPPAVDVPETAKSRIDILSGTVEIQDINQGTDYKDGSNLYEKAILNIIKADPEDPSRETLVKNPHKIDTIIEAIVDSVTDPTKQADKEIIHDLYDDWSTDAPGGHPATCTESGLEVRWCHFDGCDIDGHGTKYSQSREIPALGHLITTGWVTTDPYTHWHVCDRCHEHVDIASHIFTDWTYDQESGKDERSCTVCSRHEEKTHVHSLVKHDAIEPTCTEDGNIEYWQCSRCGKYFADEGATQEKQWDDIVIPKLNHPGIVHVPGHDATCTEDGNIEYWHCPLCLKYFTVYSEGTYSGEKTYEELIIPAIGHVPVHHDAVAPTCTEDGNIEYWQCSRCNHYFNQASCSPESEITEAETVIEALGHDWEDTWTTDGTNHWHKCKRDNTHKKDIAEHIFEFYYSFENGILNISHECNVCHRGATTPHYHEEGVFHLYFVDDMVVAYDSVNNKMSVSMDHTDDSYSYLKWYDINGKYIPEISETTHFVFTPNGLYGFRCELYDSQDSLVYSCYAQFKYFQ